MFFQCTTQENCMYFFGKIQGFPINYLIGKTAVTQPRTLWMYRVFSALGPSSVNCPVNSEFPCNVLGWVMVGTLCIYWQCSLNVLTRKTGVHPQHQGSRWPRSFLQWPTSTSPHTAMAWLAPHHASSPIKISSWSTPHKSPGWSNHYQVRGLVSSPSSVLPWSEVQGVPGSTLCPCSPPSQSSGGDEWWL